MTLFIPFVEMKLAQELLRGEVAESLMRTDGVVDLFPLAEFAIEFFHFQRASGDLVELLGVGAVGAFDGAVEFGRARGQHEQMQAALLAGLFELGGELGAAIDLHGADGKGHAVLQSIEELGSGLGGGASVRLNHIPAGDHVAGGELFEDHAGYRTHVQGIDLDQIAGLGDRVLLGFAHGIGTGPQSAARSRNPAAGRFHQPALRFSWVRMRPTMEVETGRCWRRRSTASLSLPQRGNCNRKVKTFSSKGKVQVGWRRRWGRWLRASSVLKSNGS